MERKNRAVVGWIMYDWANSAFALTVLAAFFPVFFKKYWCAGMAAPFTTTKLGIGNAVAGALIALMSPLLGALADAGRMRKASLVCFMLLGSILTALFPLIGQGQWQFALALFVLANFGWACANLFYDSLLPVVAGDDRIDFVSSLGFSIGYLGCAVLFALNILMVSKPALFGLRDAAQAVKVSFLTVSAWWMVFSVPLMLFVHEDGGGGGKSIAAIIVDGARQLKRTIRDIIGMRHIRLFLIAYWLYIDGVDTFIRMAADLGLSIGLDAGALMVSLLIVQIVAFPAALAFGFLARRIGVRACIFIGIGIYIFITIVGPLWVHTSFQYRVMAALSALPLGCLQALSRSYFARIIPADRSAEFFGFYNLMGKFAAIVGPAIVAIVSYLVESRGFSSSLAARLGFCSITALFISGAVMLMAAGRAGGRSREVINL